MKKHFLALAAVAALAATPAFAATVVQTHTINSKTTPASTKFSFDQFDSSLGTLNSVTLSFDANVSSTGSLKNTSNREKVFTLSKFAEAGLSGAGFDLDASLLSGQSQYDLKRNKSASISFSGSDSDTETLSSGLAAFIGNGDLDFTFSRQSHFSLSPSESDCDWGLVSKIWGDATLTYDYTAPPPPSHDPPPISAVPEPGVWSLLILGFAGLGAALRRQRHEGVAAVVA